MRMIAIALALLAGAAFTAPSIATAQQAPGPSTSAPAESEDAFGARVRAYLLAHPEVIMEAVQVLERRQKAAQAEALKGVIAARADELLRDPQAPVGGNPAGDVSIIEFFDYNCPYCRRVAPDVALLLEGDAGLRLVYKEFPILGPGSEAAARVALAAARQGKYAPLHDALMRTPEKVTEESALRVAATLGLDVDRLRADMADPAIETAIARNRALAAELGINGTPSFVIGQSLVPGAVERPVLETLIREARAQAAARSP
jgi:protein-disulfide isomerase